MLAIPFFSMLIVGLFSTQRVLSMRLPEPYQLHFHCYVTGVQGMIIAFCICATFGSYIHMDFLWWYLGTAGALPLVARRIRNLDVAQRRAEAEYLADATITPAARNQVVIEARARSL
jgi:hypothetical protein